jgi:Rab-like protein 2
MLIMASLEQVFDVTRKVTYQNLASWYKELREYCENIPCFLVANKIDVDMAVCTISLGFFARMPAPL